MIVLLIRQATTATSADSSSGVVGSITRAFDLSSGVLLDIVLRFVFIWFLVWVGNRVVRLVTRRIVKAVDDGNDSSLSAREKRGQTAAQLIQSVGQVATFTFGLMATLNIFIDIGPILAGAGILGLAISFGSQSLVKDIISGFFILLEDQFVVGDIIDAGGKTGTVERMTLRLVTIRDLRGVVHLIPNGELHIVSNLTRSWSRAVVDIGISYAADLDNALEVFKDEARRFGEDTDWKDRLLGNPEVVGVDELGDNAVVIRTMVRSEPGKQWESAREFRRRIKNRLDQEGIEIPFPQRTVHIRQAGGEEVEE